MKFEVTPLTEGRVLDNVQIETGNGYSNKWPCTTHGCDNEHGGLNFADLLTSALFGEDDKALWYAHAYHCSSCKSYFIVREAHYKNPVATRC